MFILFLKILNCSYRSGVGKLRPAGHIQPRKGKNAAKKHVFFNETHSENGNIHANVVNE